MTESLPLEPSIHNFVANELNIRDFEVFALAGDASARRYYRIVHKNDSWVLMHWEPFIDDGRFPFLNIQSHFRKHGVQVPNVLGKAPKLGAILLEDLGDLTLERKFWENQNSSEALPHYKDTITELVKIHYPSTQDTSSNCVAFQTTFTVDKLLWEMNYGLEHLIERLAKIKLTNSSKNSLQNIFTTICEILDAQEKHICHRDLHSRNIMIKLGKVRVIDFQDARMGPIQYDLVSLIYDAYVNLSDKTREKILEDYLLKAKEATGAPLSRDEFYHILRVQTLQRAFKACGSFASFYNMREDLRYLKYIKPSLNRVYQTLQDFPEFSDFKNLIEDNGLIEMNFTDPTQLQSTGV